VLQLLSQKQLLLLLLPLQQLTCLLLHRGVVTCGNTCIISKPSTSYKSINWLSMPAWLSRENAASCAHSMLPQPGSTAALTV
jgi:hypothetical protein